MNPSSRSMTSPATSRPESTSSSIVPNASCIGTR
jgi:hypothetical protein